MNKKNLNHNQYKKSSFDLVLIQEHRGIRSQQRDILEQEILNLNFGSQEECWLIGSIKKGQG